jgi:hypothetical protein
VQHNEIEHLEKSMGRLEGLHREIGALARKSPNDALNTFKLTIVNASLADAHQVLGSKYKPVVGFDAFDLDDLPSNSDVTLILAQYLEELERKRADNIYEDVDGWYYRRTDGKQALIRTGPPRKIGQRK